MQTSTLCPILLFDSSYGIVRRTGASDSRFAYHIYLFNQSFHSFFIASLGIAAFLFLFFLNSSVAFAQNSSVSAPGWLSDEYMAAELEIAEHVEASASTNVASEGAYNRTFIISAYYSPLEGQQRYVTGSLSGDIRLNGSGVNGADGTPVYPGMIAAPKTYAFGTKMSIPGIGTVAVHDRGGAIVTSGNRGNAYDRLDVWMGYGDQGLQRALQWGKRTVDVTVYGLDSSVQEHIELDGYSSSESQSVPNSLNAPTELSAPVAPTVQSTPIVKAQLFSQQLTLGHAGDDVARLQQKLKDLHYYNGDISATFDRATYDAVEAFQVAERIIPSAGSFGAGYVGPRTMSVLASTENSSPALATAHAKATAIDPVSVLNTDLKLGDSGAHVERLQEELRRVNLLGIEATGYYGEVTEHAVFKFQQVHGLAGDMNSVGAGIFGPMTRTKFNTVIAARLDTDRERLARTN